MYLWGPQARLQRRVALLAALVILPTVAIGQGSARFVGDLILKVLPDGRNMELAAPFQYVDSRGISWSVPMGTRIDGASIPSPLWSLIGAPFTGKFREASVIHDYYCRSRSRHWKAVHKVFLDGMNARGVDPMQARLMYLAVYRFGPRWEFDADACNCKGCPVCSAPVLKRIKRHQPKFNQSEYEELRQRLESGAYTVEQIEQLADYQVNSDIFR